MGKIVTKGLYQYKDLVTNIPVYIGKDSNMHKNSRNSQHNHPSKYNQQKINQVIQNNPERYEYSVIYEYPNLTNEELNWLECMEIMKHKFLYDKIPKFNFTIGGEGSTGYRKPYEDFEYTVAKVGKRGFTISDRNHKHIKSCKDKSKLEPIVNALNNGEITEEEVKEINLNPFEYTIAKAGKSGFTICGKNYKSIKSCKDKSKLEPIVDALNNGKITEEEVKATNLNPSEYTIAKAGKNGFKIYGRNYKPIKSCKDKGKLEPIVDALNNGKITEEEVKKTHGVKKILDMLEN